MNDYVVMERNLVKSMVETMEKQNVPITNENISWFINKALTSIIFHSMYNYFTSRNNARQRVQYYFPSDYVNFVIDRVDEFLSKGNGYNKKTIVKENVDFKKIREYINIYAEKIFPRVVSKEVFNNATTVNEIGNLIFNKKFYKPSNECREAIMSGKQTKVSTSSAKICGMKAYSNVGKVRKNQEDSYYIGVHPENEDFKLMLVADGMGGHSNGELASNIAAKEMFLFFEKLSGTEFYNDNNQELKNRIIDSLVEIDEKIKMATNRGGTTLCFAIIKKNNILMGNIGDSRGLILENGRMIYSTVSQNFPYRMEIPIPEPFDRFHPRSNVIYNSLGNFDRDCDKNRIVVFDVIKIDEKKEYDVVICSDGVSDCLSNDQIINVVNSNKDNDVAKALVNKALDTNSKFSEEYSNQYKKVKAGIISVSDWKRINEALDSGNLNVKTALEILGGKDNTTAVSGRVSRKR